MAGGWRYTTTNCVRHWRWYLKVGPALRPIYGPCFKAAALGLPLLVGPALSPLYAAPGFGGFPAAPPGEYGAAPWGSPFWPGGFGPGGFGSGYWFPQTALSPGAAAVSAGYVPADVGVLPAPTASGGSPLNSSEQPIPVSFAHEAPAPVKTPEPASLALLAVGAALAMWRRRA